MIFFSFKRNEYLNRFALKAGRMVNVFIVSLAIKRSFIKQMTSRQCQTFPQYIQNFPHIFYFIMIIVVIALALAKLNFA